MLIAKAGLFSPTNFNTVSAIVKAAPLRSSITPIIVPAIITIPIFSAVPPNPFATAPITFTGSIPADKPTKKADSNNAKNACTLNFEIIKTINKIAAAKITNSIGPCTIKILSLMHLSKITYAIYFIIS
ncbi:hypothetical protein SDC9_96807 [bioreactor metagenome]|uniref:Uncharacterized protein n=1 Tax=bioreactor metagenome TaxID=1076179 RepID=A0A645AGV2_9ZZZZ